ncbi:MAG: NAD(+) synthase, partial [Selenomonadaceae bacterium]|nr:NAD(+) synthase [Selenomonadaceae bacterium]
EGLYCIELDKVDSMPVINETNESEAAQIYNAIHYGVKEFLSQIGMKKIVIGISGGIDSAVDAALYTKILGAENVLLVNMPSVFNSATTRGLSEQLAKNLGCNYMVVPIQESVDHTINQIESTPMTFLMDSSSQKITLSSFVRENMQARDRSARVLATLAAAFGGGFTCNANKAETTVGYATMYGDSAGVVSALADLWKYQVYALAHYLNDVVYGREVIPQGIIDIVPSAELSTAQNVDEGKGDPLKYPYHDYLLRSFVEYNKLPEDILNYYIDGHLEDEIGCEHGLVKKYFATDADFIADLERWWNMFTGIAVAKRIQSPPIIAVSQRPFGSDFKEAQHGSYYTKAYKELKTKLLSK